MSARRQQPLASCLGTPAVNVARPVLMAAVIHHNGFSKILKAFGASNVKRVICASAVGYRRTGLHFIGNTRLVALVGRTQRFADHCGLLPCRLESSLRRGERDVDSIVEALLMSAGKEAAR